LVDTDDSRYSKGKTSEKRLFFFLFSTQSNLNLFLATENIHLVRLYENLPIFDN